MDETCTQLMIYTILLGMQENSIEKIEEILRQAKNTHIGGSEHEKALIELDIRGRRLEREAFTEQKKFFQDINENLKQIHGAIRYLSKEPTKSVFWAGLFAVLVGTLVNLCTDFIHWLVGLIL